jgi:TRAP-type C4-dicarboxylate transport system permease small subunit
MSFGSKFKWIEYYFHPSPAGNAEDGAYDGEGVFQPVSRQEVVEAFAFCGCLGVCCYGILMPVYLFYPWCFLTVTSLVEILQNGQWTPFVIYALISMSVFVFFALLAWFGVSNIQRHYKNHYPGTPGVQVNIPGISNHFRTARWGYLFLGMLVVFATIAALVVAITQPAIFSRGREDGNTLLVPGWIAFHFVTAISFIRCFYMFSSKVRKLENPPTYTMGEMPPPVEPLTLPSYSQ